MGAHQHKSEERVTYRRVDANGKVIRRSDSAVFVRHNTETGRVVVPTLLQEGKSIVNIWLDKRGNIVVDLYRPSDKET